MRDESGLREAYRIMRSHTGLTIRIFAMVGVSEIREYFMHLM